MACCCCLGLVFTVESIYYAVGGALEPGDIVDRGVSAPGMICWVSNAALFLYP